MTTLDDFAGTAAAEHGLAVTSTVRDHTISCSVVSVGVLTHPVTRLPVVGFVARSDSRKFANLRRHPVSPWLQRPANAGSPSKVPSL